MTNDKTPFASILIANRGEIAVRVIRTAKAMGLKTVAVYSDADAAAPHLKLADEATCIGPAPAANSYLNIDAILKAARQTGAQAIHPGYGFLSENADFAKACAAAGLVFIGPSPEAISLMGDKAKAKRRLIAADIPCVPGYEGEEQSDARLLKEAHKIGFPIMVKAAAGGGGRGMRFVATKDDLPAALATARSEAVNAFGSDALILERALVRPRHVEMQIFGDSHGGVIHLEERDCSVQRRHQKVIEEAPSPAMTPEMREKMGEAAVKAAREINYEGAGTVEFLLDANGAFYFLEMNTRLQVEHPVTEMTTGLDLVEWQIRVARGEPLPLSQNEIALSGHAIEARLYAEDVSAGFLPATGSIDCWRPAKGKGVRVDAGIETGGEVSPFYDSMLAKIIAHGTTREEARRRLIGALKRTALFGVTTNRGFLIDVLSKDAFINGDVTTAFIEEEFSGDKLTTAPLAMTDAVIAAMLFYLCARERALAQAVSVSRPLLNWASATDLIAPYRFENGDGVIDVDVEPTGRSSFLAHTDGAARHALVDEFAEHDAAFFIDGEPFSVAFNAPAPSRIQFATGGRDFDLINLNSVFASATEHASAGAVAAPMHGALVEIFAAEGERVEKGARLAILEAMKMQHELTSPISGAVSAVHATAGEQVAAGSLLFEIEAHDS